MSTPEITLKEQIRLIADALRHADEITFDLIYKGLGEEQLALVAKAMDLDHPVLDEERVHAVAGALADVYKQRKQNQIDKAIPLEREKVRKEKSRKLDQHIQEWWQEVEEQRCARKTFLYDELLKDEAGPQKNQKKRVGPVVSPEVRAILEEQDTRVAVKKIKKLQIDANLDSLVELYDRISDSHVNPVLLPWVHFSLFDIFNNRGSMPSDSPYTHMLSSIDNFDFESHIPCDSTIATLYKVKHKVKDKDRKHHDEDKKVFKLWNMPDNRFELDEWQREISTMLSLISDPYIVQLKKMGWGQHTEFGLPKKYAFIVMEALSFSLIDILKGKPLPWEKRIRIALDVALGLESLYRYGIIHANLNPYNVFLDRNYRAKLTGFNLSRKLHQVSRGWGATRIGALWTMAPEALKVGTSGYREESDIFSFGAVLARLVAWDSDCIHRPKIRWDCPPKLRTLIDWCLQEKPEARPTISQVIQALNWEYLRFIPQPFISKFSKLIGDSHIERIIFGTKEQMFYYLTLAVVKNKRSLIRK